MPYTLSKDGDKWTVRKADGDGRPIGDPLGSHDSKEEAMAQQRALYAAENSKSWAVKFADDGEDWLEGAGMPFGGPFNGADLDGEHFSKNTDFAFDWFPERPLLYHHGLDKDAGIAVVGRVKAWETKADLGVWTKTQLDASSEYFEAIKELVKQGKLFFSSGAMRHLVQVNKKSGEIMRWPWVELSLTPTPSNLLATVDFADAEKHFKAAGIDLSDEAKAEITTRQRESLDDSDFAYIDADGGRHLPMHDEAHVRNALARFDQTEFESEEAKRKARRKLEARAKEMGVEMSSEKAMTEAAMRKMIQQTADNAKVDMTDAQMAEMMDTMSSMMDAPLGDIMKKIGSLMDKMAAKKAVSGSYEELMDKLHHAVNPMSPFSNDCWSYVVATFPDHMIVERHEDGESCFWKVSYTVNDMGEVMLGQAEEVEQSYTPAKGFAETPLSIYADMTHKMAVSLLERTKDLQERRLKEGRMISSANRKRLMQSMEAMRAAMDEMESLMSASEPQAKASATLWRLRLGELALNAP